MAELLRRTEGVGAKLVLVGDPRQLPEIEAGGTFRALAHRTDPIHLRDNRRQQHAWERAALDLLATGQADEALARYHQHGRLVIGDNAADTRQRLVEDWWRSASAGEDAIIVALRRIDVGELNERARTIARTAGALGADELHVGRRDLAVGDRLVCLRNDPRLGITNGTHGTITRIDRAAGSLTLTDRDGRHFALTPDYLQTPTRTGGPSIDYGYALTGHKAQGMTASRAFVLGSPELYREWGYVALSRGRAENRLYVVAPADHERDEIAPTEPRPTPIESIIRAMQRSQAQVAAMEIGRASELQVVPTDALEVRGKDLRRAEQASRRRERRTQVLAEQRDRANTSRQPADGRMSRADLTAAPSAEAPRDECATITSKLHAVQGELARRRRPVDVALVLDPPPYMISALGPPPEATHNRHAWLQLARRIHGYREHCGITDPDCALPEPRAGIAERHRLEQLQHDIDAWRTPDLDRDRDAPPREL